MNPLQRRRPAPVEPTEPEAGDGTLLTSDRPRTAAGKGRVTPKRSDALAARKAQRKGVPTSKKEASARRREQIAETRAALKSTDPAKLPVGERKTELVYARDLVDSRRNLAGFFIPGAAFFLILTDITAGLSKTKHNHTLGSVLYAAAIAFFIAMLFDSWLLGRMVAARVLTRWPDSTQPVRWYAARRSFLLKRFRRPVVRVRPGDDPWGRRTGNKPA